MPQVRADLDLDASSALSAAEQLGSSISDALDSAASGFADTLANAVGSANNSSIDIPVTIDTSQAEAAIGDLSNAPPVDVPIQVDTSSAEAALSSLENAPPVDVPVHVDMAEAESQIAAIGTGLEPIDVPVNADVSGGQDVEGLAADLADVSDQGNKASLGMDTSTSAAAALGGISAAASGDIGGLAEHIRDTGAGAAAAVAGVLAVGAGVHELANAGMAGHDALITFNSTVGPFKDAVENIHVGNLNTNLEDLGHKLGSTKSEMENAAAASFRYADAAGHGGAVSAAFTTEVTALAARAIGLNANLGTLSDVQEVLTNRLGRGGSRLAEYGIALSQSEIKSHALVMGLGDANGALSNQEKAIAAADLAIQKYGTSIKQNVDGATKLASVQVAQLGAQFRETFEKLGLPLVAPTIDAMRGLQPAATAAASAIAALGSAFLPLVGVLAGGLSTPLTQFSDVISSMPSGVLALAAAFVVLRIAIQRMGLDGFAQIGSRMTGMLADNALLVGGLGAAFGTMGVATNNAAEAVTGFATAGAALGSVVGTAFGLPVLGTILGAVGGAIVGYTFNLANAADRTDKFQEAQDNLGKAIKSKSEPSIEEAGNKLKSMLDVIEPGRSIVGKFATTFEDLSDSLKGTGKSLGDFTDGQDKLTASGARHLTSLVQEKVATDAWTDAMKQGPDVMAATVTMLDHLGVNTSKYQLSLDTTVAAEKAAESAHASLQASISPLTTSFSTAAQAVGGDTEAMFGALGALGRYVDANVKAESSQQNFVKALGTGDPLLVQQAATAAATAAGMARYNDVLFHTHDATAAATEGTNAAVAELQRLADLPGVSPEMRASIQQLVGDLQAAAAVDAKPKISLDIGDSLIKATSIKAAVDDMVNHASDKKIILDLDAAKAVDKTGMVQQAINAIKQGVPPPIALQDLASQTIGTVNSLIAQYQAQHPETTLNADPAPALSGVGVAINAGNTWAASHPTTGIHATDDFSGVIASAQAAAANWAGQHPSATIDAIDRATATINGVVAALQAVQDKHITITAETVGVGGMVLPRQAGGPFEGGQTMLVGEAGPEIVQFPRDGNVVPNHQIGNVMGGGGNEPDERMHALLERIAVGIESGGGDVLVQVGDEPASRISPAPAFVRGRR